MSLLCNWKRICTTRSVKGRSWRRLRRLRILKRITWIQSWTKWRWPAMSPLKKSSEFCRRLERRQALGMKIKLLQYLDRQNIMIEIWKSMIDYSRALLAEWWKKPLWASTWRAYIKQLHNWLLLIKDPRVEFYHTYFYHRS